VFHQTPFFVTDQREQGFEETIKKEYPDIEIVAQQGIAGPDFAGDAQAAANAMLTQNPTLDGIWAVWAVPGEGVMAAARASGRSDLLITTVDLETPVAISLASNGLVKGLSSQLPFDQGIAEAKIAGYGLLGKKAPPFVVVPPLPVTHDNVLEAWRTVYHEEPPANLKDSYEQK
ncbi:MAG: substrate-binding domain-containing protein, partial [Haloechinothrix sp.]